MHKLLLIFISEKKKKQNNLIIRILFQSIGFSVNFTVNLFVPKVYSYFPNSKSSNITLVYYLLLKTLAKFNYRLFLLLTSNITVYEKVHFCLIFIMFLACCRNIKRVCFVVKNIKFCQYFSNR